MLQVRIERTRGGFPALREVLEREKFLIVLNKEGQRKRAAKSGLIRINTKDIVAVAINCNSYFSISIYEIVEILDSENYMYVREINKYQEGVWYDIIPQQQQQLENIIIETINLINGGGIK